MKTVYALFRDYREAKGAVERLTARDFNEDDMNVIARAPAPRKVVKFDLRRRKRQANRREQSMASARRLLSGRHSLVALDVGMVHVAGRMAALLSRTAQTNAQFSSGLKKAFVDFRVPEEIAEFYKRGISEGAILLWVRTEEKRANEAANLLSVRKGLAFR